jgi:hypothetical protein
MNHQPEKVGISALAIRKGYYLRHGGYESETTVTKCKLRKHSFCVGFWSSGQPQSGVRVRSCQQPFGIPNEIVFSCKSSAGRVSPAGSFRTSRRSHGA